MHTNLRHNLKLTFSKTQVGTAIMSYLLDNSGNDSASTCN